MTGYKLYSEPGYLHGNIESKRTGEYETELKIEMWFTTVEKDAVIRDLEEIVKKYTV